MSSLMTEIGRGPFTTVVMPTVAIGPRGLPGPGSVLLGNVESGLLPIRFVGVAEHAGPPNAGDGAFEANDVAFDNTGQQWLCVVSGTPGTWLAVGSGKILAHVLFNSDFTMTTAATEETIPGSALPWVYDGRPIRGVVTPLPCSQNVASVKQITSKIVRSSDNALVRQGFRQTTASVTESQTFTIDTGPLTAHPSDASAYVPGNTYTWALRLASGSSSKATMWAGIIQPVSFYVITC